VATARLLSSVPPSQMPARSSGRPAARAAHAATAIVGEDQHQRDHVGEPARVAADRAPAGDRRRNAADGDGAREHHAERVVDAQAPGDPQTRVADRHDHQDRLHEPERADLERVPEDETGAEDHEPGLEIMLAARRLAKQASRARHAAEREAEDEAKDRGFESPPIDREVAGEEEGRERQPEHHREPRDERAHPAAREGDRDGSDDEQAEAEDPRAALVRRRQHPVEPGFGESLDRFGDLLHADADQAVDGGEAVQVQGVDADPQGLPVAPPDRGGELHGGGELTPLQPLVRYDGDVVDRGQLRVGLCPDLRVGGPPERREIDREADEGDGDDDEPRSDR
jgi:hypothetical protein